MYIACVSLRLKDRVAQPGDPVPEAASWNPIVLKTHLEWEKIKWVDDAVTEEKPQKKHKSKTKK